MITDSRSRKREGTIGNMEKAKKKLLFGRQLTDCIAVTARRVSIRMMRCSCIARSGEIEIENITAL